MMAPDPTGLALAQQIEELRGDIQELSSSLKTLQTQSVTRVELYLTLMVVVMGAIIIGLLIILFLRGA